MRCWLPDYIYRPFPYVTAMIGLLGCLGCSAPCLILGGALVVYGCGVMCMRGR